MQLDTQVEELPQAGASNAEHKHKHRKKDKHKHKHHKKSKRDRHDPSSSALPDESLVETVEDQVVGIGVEDGELPGPPVAEAPLEPSSVGNATQVHASQQPADFDSSFQADVQEPHRKRRWATVADVYITAVSCQQLAPNLLDGLNTLVVCRSANELQAEHNKRSRLAENGVPGQSVPFHPDLPVLDALVSQPDINDIVDSSTVLPVPDSAAAHGAQRSERHRFAAEQLKPRQHDVVPADSTTDARHIDPSDKRKHQSRPQESDRPRDTHRDSHRSERHGSHRSSSRRPEDSSDHRSHSQRPSDRSDRPRQHERPQQESRTDSRVRHRPTETVVGGSDRQLSEARPSSRSDVRDSSCSRHVTDARARGHNRDQHRDRYRDQIDGRRHGSDRQDPSAGRDRRHETHRESDSHREKRKRAEKEVKVCHVAARDRRAHCIQLHFQLAALADLSYLCVQPCVALQTPP